jgi:hypothetical protein
VRKLLVAVGLVAFAAPALAMQDLPEREYSDHNLNRESFKALKKNPNTVRVRLDRTMGDQLGPNVDIYKVCGGAGAQRVDVRRNPGDVLATFFTIGFYSPTHAYVLCNIK